MREVNWERTDILHYRKHGFCAKEDEVLEEIYVEAGKRIRALREKSRYTREQFAEIANISPKFLYEIETGQKGFSASTLFYISRGLGTSCEYILTGMTANEINWLDSINLFTESQKLILNQILQLIMELKLSV